MATAAERLAALETAIDGFIAGGCVKAYEVEGGIKVTKENLAAMLDARDRLRNEASVASRRRSGGFMRADLRGCL